MYGQEQLFLRGENIIINRTQAVCARRDAWLAIRREPLCATPRARACVVVRSGYGFSDFAYDTARAPATRGAEWFRYVIDILLNVTAAGPARAGASRDAERGSNVPHRGPQTCAFPAPRIPRRSVWQDDHTWPCTWSTQRTHAHTPTQTAPVVPSRESTTPKSYVVSK